MKYIIILAITMISCVIREKICCTPSDCMPQTKKVIVNPIKIKHIPTYEEYIEHELMIIELEIKQSERRLKFIEKNINNIIKDNNKIKSYHELQTRVHPVHIKSNFTDSISSIKRIISIDTNRN